MAFSTQRDFINFPPCVREDSALSVAAGVSNDLSASHPTAMYSTFLQDLTNLWNRLSGKPHRERPHGGAETSQDDEPMSASNSCDSGVTTEQEDDHSIRTMRDNDDNCPGGARTVLDGVEDMLIRLEGEGNLTIETIMQLIRKYQDYIKQLLMEGQVPEGGLKKLLEYIESMCNQIIQNVGNSNLPEKMKNDLIEDVNSLSSALKTYMCEAQRETDNIYQEMQKANFDRQSMQVTLQKLTSVEGKIVDLKAQASKANELEKAIQDLKDQLEKSQKSNHVLVQRLMTARREQNEAEERYKNNQEKLFNECQKWKCQAELLNDINQRETLELQKWKVHCNRLSLELDRATERIIKGHETKRKLYFAESMRTELERQIEEMMTIIKQLSEQNKSGGGGTGGGRLQRKPKDCEKVLSNLINQSKNTLRSILSNVQEGFGGDDSSQQGSISKLRDENLKLKAEISRLNAKDSSDRLKLLEDQISDLQRELDGCRDKQKDYLEKNEELESLREQLEKCQEENMSMKRRLNENQIKNVNNERWEEDKRKLEEQLDMYRNENKSLKETLKEKVNASFPQVSKEVVVNDLQQRHDDSLSGASMKTIRSNPEHGDGGTAGIIIGPQSGSSANDIEILSSQTCTCKIPLSCTVSPVKAKIGVNCPESEESSMISSGSEVDTHTSESKPESSVGMADIEKLLQNKNETIQKLEKQCSCLQEDLKNIGGDRKQQTMQLVNVMRLEKQLSRLGGELAEQGSLLQLAKDQLKVQKNDIKESKQLLVNLQARNNLLLQDNLRLQNRRIERAAFMTDAERQNESLVDESKEYANLELQLANARNAADVTRKEFNSKVRKMLEEKSKLESENTRLLKELEGLDVVVDEVNVERSKNRKLEKLIEDLEANLKSLQRRGSQSSGGQKSINYMSVVDKLKQQLDEEVSANDKLRDSRAALEKEVDDLKKMLKDREEEVSKLKMAVSAKKISQVGPIILQDANDTGNKQGGHAKYTEFINQLRTELDSEKHRYLKLRTKFIAYSLRIEDLEKKLRHKRAVIEREMESYPDLMEVAGRHALGRSNFGSDHTITRDRNLQCQKDTNKRLQLKLILNFLKNEKLNGDYKRAKNQIENLQKQCDTKEEQIEQLKNKMKKLGEILRPHAKRLQSGVERVASSSGSVDDGDSDEVEEKVSLLQVARDFQEITDQLKHQLAAEKENTKKLQSQIDEDNEKIEDLKSKMKKLQGRNAQLRDAIDRREKNIDELQKNIEELTSITSLEDKGVQTMEASSDKTSSDLKSQLDSQIKRNYELAQDYSKEIANTQSLRSELRQAQREMRKLCRCVEEIEKDKESLQKQNAELTKELTDAKGRSGNATCKNATCTCVRSQKPGASSEAQKSMARISQKSSRKDDQYDDLQMKLDKKVKGGLDTRLQQICCKIQEEGLKSLNVKDLAYLHREVYTAGRKMRISESESTQEKCLEFVANLPPIPANREETIMARVNYLETELDNANQVLQHLKMEYEKESRSDGRERHRGGENKIPPRDFHCEITGWANESNRSF